MRDSRLSQRGGAFFYACAVMSGEKRDDPICEDGYHVALS